MEITFSVNDFFSFHAVAGEMWVCINTDRSLIDDSKKISATFLWLNIFLIGTLPTSSAANTEAQASTKKFF